MTEIKFKNSETLHYQMVMCECGEVHAETVQGMPEATEATLDINGISVLVKGDMAFPVGHVLPMGQPGDISSYTPSEAFGYAMRNAVFANDKAFYQKLLNGYLYLVNQTTLYRQNQMGMSGSQLAVGLIGWSPNIMNIMNGASPFPPDLGTQFVSSASDADTDIMSSMLDAMSLWGVMTATDDLTPPGANIISKVAIDDLASDVIDSFVANELGNFSFQGKNYYALTLDNWGHDIVYPDYFDPTAFAKMITYVGADSQTGQALASAAQGTMQYVTDVAAANGNWIPDTPYNLSGASSFGYDATRILMRFGEYLSLNADPLNMAPAVGAVLKNLVSNIFSNGGSYLQWQQGGSVTFSPSGLGGGSLSGPLSNAVDVLNVTDNLPADVTQTDVINVQNALSYDLTQYQTDSMQNWQNWYYPIQLGVLNRAMVT